VDANLPKWDAFFARHAHLFDWRRPDGSCMAFVRYKGADGVTAFTRSLVEESGVLFLPSTIYASDLGETPTDRLRLGFGRLGLDEGIAALDAHLARNNRV
jgi:aspartate/methionine/tyrosine aminotransferase